MMVAALNQQAKAESITWTEERIVSLREMVASGQSGGQIASALGLTRNQVVGKVMRLNLKLGSYQPVKPKEKPAPKPAAEKPAKVAASRAATHTTKSGAPLTAPPEVAEQFAQTYVQTPARQRAFDPAFAPAEARMVPLSNLQPGLCKWPLFEDGPHLFCGADVQGCASNGQPGSYCDTHQAMSLAKEVSR